MTITYEPSTITLPNITVEDKYIDDVLTSRRLTANDGYVMYDTTANDIAPTPDPETGEIIPVPITYYYRQATVPIRYPANIWVAVPENEVPVDQIFGGGDEPESEV